MRLATLRTAPIALAVVIAGCAAGGASAARDAGAEAADASDEDLDGEDVPAPEPEPEPAVEAPDAADDPTTPDGATPDATDGGDAGCVPIDPTRCDLVCQTGCGEGEKCGLDVERWKTECQPDGTQGAGETCSGRPDNCRRGFICLGSGPSTCRRFCRDDADCTADRSHCDTTVSGSSFTVCGRPPDTCDPLVPTAACPAGTACYVGDTDDDTHCYPAGSAALGEACARLVDCRPGLVCLGTAPGHYTCHELCAVPGGACTEPDAVCRPLPGLTRYGACRPAA